jgi:hypothetical protein
MKEMIKKRRKEASKEGRKEAPTWKEAQPDRRLANEVLVARVSPFGPITRLMCLTGV